jgi:hypothetical protein
MMDDKDSLGQESIFALQPTTSLHDVIITCWCGYWCTSTRGVSNYSITNHVYRKNKYTTDKMTELTAKRKFFSPPLNFGATLTVTLHLLTGRY